MSAYWHNHLSPTTLRFAAGLLFLDAVGMALLLNGLLPVSKGLLLSYHFITALYVSYVAACILVRTSTPHRFNPLVTAGFAVVLVIFNPLYPLILTTMHAIVAAALAAMLFGYHATRLNRHAA